MKKFIAFIANKYSKNPYIRRLFRPIWQKLHNLEHQRQVSNFKKNGLQVLSLISNACSRQEIIFWLDFGTLLGAYRDNNFIKHDFDIDLGVMFNCKEKFQSSLIHEGFSLVREFRIMNNDKLEGIEQTYSYKSVLVDVFYYHPNKDNKFILHSFTPITDDEKFRGKAEIKEIEMPNYGFKKFNFKGILVYIPNNTSEYLKYYYGKNFMIPDPHYNYKDTMSNIKFFDRNQKTADYIEYKRLYL